MLIDNGFFIIQRKIIFHISCRYSSIYATEEGENMYRENYELTMKFNLIFRLVFIVLKSRDNKIIKFLFLKPSTCSASVELG